MISGHHDNLILWLAKQRDKTVQKHSKNIPKRWTLLQKQNKYKKNSQQQSKAFYWYLST